MAEAGPDRVRHAGVLGRPIGHSLSPALHRAAYAALGLTWTYEAIDCGVDDLDAVLAQRGDWAGFSATMPLKRALLRIAAEIRPLARAVGAANTLTPHPAGGWVAENTDVTGIVVTVRAAGIAPRTATVLGAGGTAQAAVAALAELGLPGCVVLVRDVARTVELRATAAALGVTLEVGVLGVDAPALAADLVVSTLPRGAADPLVAAAWRPEQSVLDVVYEAWPTRLAAAVAAAGGLMLSGAAMLLHQAEAQVELMTGRPAPHAEMAAALRAASAGR